MSHINAHYINLFYRPKDQALKFSRKILRIGGIEKLSFFESAILESFLKNKHFFCFIPMKISQSFLGSKDGSKFWWLSCCWGFREQTPPPLVSQLWCPRNFQTQIPQTNRIPWWGLWVAYTTVSLEAALRLPKVKHVTIVRRIFRSANFRRVQWTSPLLSWVFPLT